MRDFPLYSSFSYDIEVPAKSRASDVCLGRRTPVRTQLDASSTRLDAFPLTSALPTEEVDMVAPSSSAQTASKLDASWECLTRQLGRLRQHEHEARNYIQVTNSDLYARNQDLHRQIASSRSPDASSHLTCRRQVEALQEQLTIALRERNDYYREVKFLETQVDIAVNTVSRLLDDIESMQRRARDTFDHMNVAAPVDDKQVKALDGEGYDQSRLTPH